MVGVQGTSTWSDEAGRRTQLLAKSFFSEKSTIQLVTGLDQRMSVNLNRNLLLLHSPLLRSIFSSTSNSGVLFIPDVSLPSLIDLELLLKKGLARLHTANQAQAQDIKDCAKILGIPLNKLSLLKAQEINPKIQTNPMSSLKASVKSVEVKAQIETDITAKNRPDESTIESVVLPGVAVTQVVKVEREVDFQTSLDDILGRDESAAPERESGKKDELEFSCQVPGQRCTGKDFHSLHKLRVHCSQHFRRRLKTTFASKMMGDECYRCKKFVDKDKMAIHIGAEHKKVDQFLRELGIVLKNVLSPEDTPTSPAKASFHRKERLTSEVLCNYDTKCEVCGRDLGISANLPIHVTSHFHDQLQERFHKLTNNLDCTLCGIGQGSIKALYRHIGVQHLKVNEILLEKGFKILPSSLTKKQDEKQDHLKRIKKEIVEDIADTDSRENIGDSLRDEEEGAGRKNEPRTYSFTDVNMPCTDIDTLYPEMNMLVS